MFAQRSACAPTTIAGLSPVMSSRRNSHSPTITEEATMASPLRVSRSSRGNVPMQGIVVQLAGHDDPEEGVQVAQYIEDIWPSCRANPRRSKARCVSSSVICVARG